MARHTHQSPTWPFWKKCSLNGHRCVGPSISFAAIRVSRRLSEEIVQSFCSRGSNNSGMHEASTGSICSSATWCRYMEYPQSVVHPRSVRQSTSGYVQLETILLTPSPITLPHKQVCPRGLGKLFERWLGNAVVTRSTRGKWHCRYSTRSPLPPCKVRARSHPWGSSWFMG